MNTLYWVSFLIQDSETSRPWVCSLSTGRTSLKDAMIAISNGRNNYRVLSAWINTFDEKNNKTTVFHECYLNALGYIESNN